MGKLYAGIAIILALSAWTYGSVKYGAMEERKDNAVQINALQKSLSLMGLAVQKQESEAADDARKLVDSDQARINAIATTDHQTGEIKRLEDLLKKEQGKHENAYRIFIPDSINRVWNESSSCDGLPEGQSASVLQKRLSDITGDDIAESIKYLHGQYCGCAIKYNKLWRSADRIIEAQQKSPE